MKRALATFALVSVQAGLVVEQLRPLLALPVELVLPAHGVPTGRAALERARSPKRPAIPRRR